jgi:hypothetical protein
MKTIILTFVTVVLLSSCKKDNTMKQETTEIPKTTIEIKSIKHGTSFGMCVGYCSGENTYTSEKAVFVGSGHNLKTLTYTKPLSTEKWEAFKSKVDREAFFDLSQTIGCPDCADGGAEWLEIETSLGQKHKVTFEYRKEPDTLRELVALLRQFEWEWELQRK